MLEIAAVPPVCTEYLIQHGRGEQTGYPAAGVPNIIVIVWRQQTYDGVRVVLSEGGSDKGRNDAPALSGHREAFANSVFL